MSYAESRRGKALRVLAYITPSELPYADWVKIGVALKNLGCDLGDWDEWSRQDKARYREGECARKWQTFSASEIGLGYLVKIAIGREARK